MSPDSPLSIILPKVLDGRHAEQVEQAVAHVPNPPLALDLLDIIRPDGADPDELLKERFLCKGGGLLMCGQTGVGKSSFNMQALVSWALGKSCFAIEPARALTSLLVQAENDSVDIAEFRDGVFRGLELTEGERASLRGRVHVVRENARTAAEFISHTLRPLVERLRPDLLWIDPALAYLGGESNSQKDVGGFLRNLLNPLLTEFQCAAVVVHHGNKPPSGQDRPQWKAGDFAYLGGGSAEWANWARAVLVIRSIGHESIYELRAAKRGRRLHWQDKEGQPTCCKYIAWSAEPNVICWREPDPDEIEELLGDDGKGRPRKLDPMEVLHCISSREGQTQRAYRNVIHTALGCSESVIQAAITACVNQGWLRFTTNGKQKLYTLTQKGKSMVGNRPTITDWISHWSEIPLSDNRPMQIRSQQQLTKHA